MVFTPFSGSGSECVAPKICVEGAICGFEINKEYYNISLERLKHCERENVQISLFEKGGV